MPPTPTVRERLERWRDRHEEAVAYLLADGMEFDDPPVATSKGYCENCGKTWPCPDFEDAVAALATLDAADLGVRFYGSPGFFPSNDAAKFAHLKGVEIMGRLVPDPLVPRLDANPNTKEDA